MKKIFFVVKKTDDLIYDLIFSDETYYLIDISNYIKDIYQYDTFISNIREVLKKSKVRIIKSEVKLDSKKVIWELKVKK
jgi:hypothetical protein